MRRRHQPRQTSVKRRDVREGLEAMRSYFASRSFSGGVPSCFQRENALLIEQIDRVLDAGGPRAGEHYLGRLLIVMTRGKIATLLAHLDSRT